MSHKPYVPKHLRTNPITDFLFDNVIVDIIEAIAITALMGIILMGSVSLIYGMIYGLTTLPFQEQVKPL